MVVVEELDQDEARVALPSPGGEFLPETRPAEYYSTQGVFFLKKTDDPRKGSIVKKKVALGESLRCTGNRWRGPGGAVWIEIDARTGQFGWALVGGPGFGLVGPALVDAAAWRSLIRVRVVLLGAPAEHGNVLLEQAYERDLSILRLRKQLSDITGLQAHLICLSKELAKMAPDGSGQRLPADYMPKLGDKVTLAEAGLPAEATLFAVYVGSLDDDMRPGILTDQRDKDPMERAEAFEKLVA